MKDAFIYALQHLNLPNVLLHVDASHGGILGWDANSRKFSFLFC